MENKTIRFSTGNLNINETNISFQLNFGSAHEVNTIGRENIGHTETQEMRVLPNVDFVYCMRMAVIGVILFGVGITVGLITNSFFVMYIGGLFMLFALFLYVGIFWLDGLLGLNIARPILISIFGVDAVRVVVQNIYGGNNLHFFVLKDEKRKIPKFEEYKLDKVYKTESLNTTPPVQEISSSNLDELKKLGELYQSGVLTKEEFEKKKKELLNNN